MLGSTKEKQMSHVIDISNKERLLEEIYRAVQLSIPNISTLRAKAELQIEIIEMMLDSGLSINDTGKKRSTDYGQKWTINRMSDEEDTELDFTDPLRGSSS
jgi:antirestriction protein ArdC